MKLYKSEMELRNLNIERRGKSRTLHIECPNCDIEMWVPRVGSKACSICGYTRTIVIR